MKQFFYISVVFLFVKFDLVAQDVHWSQFDYNPIFQNPANTGQIDGGDYRFHANYRDQWRSVTIPFQTFSISADAKSVFHDNLSLGVFVFNDVAGDGQFRTVELQPSLAWTFKLATDSSHVLRLATQFGINYRQFNADAFTFDSQWSGTAFDPSLPTNENFMTQNRTNGTIGFGAAYEWYQNRRSRLTAGIGFFNLNQPNNGFFGEDIPRHRRFNFFVQGQYKVAEKWDFLPSLQLNFQNTYREVLIGGRGRYILKNSAEEYQAIVVGSYFRTGDAAMIMGGLEWQNWWAGISYDINFSPLVPASRARGGIEFSLRYIFKTAQPGNNKIYRICPDYI